MHRILILHYSRTGNTGKMANAAVEGARSVRGVEVELSCHVLPEVLAEFDAVIIGIPTYHHDLPVDMKNLFEEAAVKNISLKGKVGAVWLLWLEWRGSEDDYGDYEEQVRDGIA